MRILVVKLGAIGDVIRTTAILKGLHEKYAPAALDWLTAASAKEVLLNNPLIARIFTWEERSELETYDLIISLEDDLEACEVAAHLKADKVIGTFIRDGKIDYTPLAWFDMSIISKYGLQKANELKKSNTRTFQQHMAELLGIKVGGYIFNLTREEIEYGREYVRDLGVGSREKVIGINTGAGGRWRFKALGVDKTIELIDRLRKELGAVSLILGGEEEKERNELIAKVTGMPNGGRHTLRHFASVINQCRLVISSDSLALHFAIALKKKVVVFFGPTSPTEIELYGLGAKVFSKKDCIACYKKSCDRQPNCMDELSVDELFQAVKREC